MENVIITKTISWHHDSSFSICIIPDMTGSKCCRKADVRERNIDHNIFVSWDSLTSENPVQVKEYREKPQTIKLNKSHEFNSIKYNNISRLTLFFWLIMFVCNVSPFSDYPKDGSKTLELINNWVIAFTHKVSAVLTSNALVTSKYAHKLPKIELTAVAKRLRTMK